MLLKWQQLKKKVKPTESKPERNGFGERTPLSGGAGGTRPTGPAPKPKTTPKPTTSSSSSSSSSRVLLVAPLAVLLVLADVLCKAILQDSCVPVVQVLVVVLMSSNPAVGYSKPVRRNFKTQAAFLKALEVYMRRKRRGEQAGSSAKPKTTKVMDGRQYGN